MTDSFVVARFDDLAPDSALRVEVEGHPISIVRIEDSVYAIGDICSHADVSLSEGFVEADDCALECPRHGALFDLKTGEPLTLPAVKPVPSYDVDIVEGDVVVRFASEDAQ